MKRWPGLTAAAFVGAVAGGLLVMALPVPGLRAPGDPQPIEVKPASIDTVLAWTPGGLPPGFAAAIRRLPAVDRVTAVRSGTAWLSRWGQVDSSTRRPPRGFQIPVEVAAVHTHSYRWFVPPAERSLVEGLRLGDAVLGSTSARLRGVDEDGWLEVAGRRLRVDGVLDDTLVGGHEVVISARQGELVGLDQSRYLLVAPRAGASPGSVERAIRRAAPAGIPLRVRTPGETPVFRHGDAVLSQVAVKDLFGEFAASPRGDGTLAVHAAWERQNIVSERVPVLGAFRCHRLVMPLVRSALDDLVSRGLGRLVNPADFGGCYYPRFIARDEGSGISHHAWGIAIDINVSEGLPGRQPTIDERIVEAFERQGFVWGGRFLIPDGTHFEFQRFP